MQELLAEINQLKELITALHEENKLLRDTIRQLKLKPFLSKSEKLNKESLQSLLFAQQEAESADAEEDDEEPEQVAVSGYKRSSRGSKLKDIPVVEEVIEPAETNCPCCSNELVEIGREVSEKLEFEPAKLFKRKITRIKKACNKCKEAGVVIAPLNPLIPGSIASVSLVVYLIVSKYQDSLPLHRLEQIFYRMGYELERKLMCDWIHYVVENYLFRIAKAIKISLLQCWYLKADETPLDVLDREQEKNIKTGYLWGMRGPPGVYFEYSETRAQSAASKLFGNYKGVLQTDLYGGYNHLECERLACMAHIRRKFINTPDCQEKTRVLQLISLLYAVEKKAKTKKQLAEIRASKSANTLQLLFTELEKIKNKYTPESDIYKGANYALKQWDDVKRILESPEYQLDNNEIEREIRSIAIGRKNWLFAGSKRGANSAAVIFTILNTCKIHGVNPIEYLTDILPRVLDYTVNNIDDLTPLKWKNNKAARIQIAA